MDQKAQVTTNTEITLWFKGSKKPNGDTAWEFNHVEDGYDPKRRNPTAHFPEQKSQFLNGLWKSEKAYFVYDELNSPDMPTINTEQK